jgi:hypothetical protein
MGCDGRFDGMIAIPVAIVKHMHESLNGQTDSIESQMGLGRGLKTGHTSSQRHSIAFAMC